MNDDTTNERGGVYAPLTFTCVLRLVHLNGLEYDVCHLRYTTQQTLQFGFAHVGLLLPGLKAWLSARPGQWVSYGPLANCNPRWN